MATAAISPSKSVLDSKLSKSNPGKIGFLIGGLVLIAGVMYAGYNLVHDLGDVKQTSIFPCERISRHRQRRRHGNLYPLARAACRRSLVRLLEFRGCAGVERRGGVRHHLTAAG